jgi:hypothetical protein
VNGFERAANSPAAVQFVVLTQSTPANAVLDAPNGVAPGWIENVPPANVSINAVAAFGSVYEPPTATHAVALAHATPVRRLCAAPARFGLATATHAEPVQRSINVRV